jgi:hypothetical protein
MLDRLMRIFRPETWQESLKRYTKELVPPSGEAETLQGELVRCIGNLSDEAHRNGWMNWDAADAEAIQILRRYLPDPDVFSATVCSEIETALDQVRFAGEKGADEGSFGFEELKMLARHVVDWCRHHPELKHKSTEASWLDDDPFSTTP